MSVAAQNFVRRAGVTALAALLWDYPPFIPLIMPPGKHFIRSAVHRCKWHDGCGKRFSSKRQLFQH